MNLGQVERLLSKHSSTHKNSSSLNFYVVSFLKVKACLCKQMPFWPLQVWMNYIMLRHWHLRNVSGHCKAETCQRLAPVVRLLGNPILKKPLWQEMLWELQLSPAVLCDIIYHISVVGQLHMFGEIHPRLFGKNHCQALTHLFHYSVFFAYQMGNEFGKSTLTKENFEKWFPSMQMANG